MKDKKHLILITFLLALLAIGNLIKVAAPDLAHGNNFISSVFSLKNIVTTLAFGSVGVLAYFVYTKIKGNNNKTT